MNKIILYDPENDRHILVDDEQKHILPFQYNQYYPDTTWIINHSLGTINFTYQVYVNNIVVTPIDVNIVDENIITIEFTNACIGFVNFMFYDVSPM